MNCLDILGVVISPRTSHSFGLNVVWNNFVAIREGGFADCTLPLLLGDLSVQQFPHFGRRANFAIPPGVVTVFDALNTKLKSAFFLRLLATAAEE